MRHCVQLCVQLSIQLSVQLLIKLSIELFSPSNGPHRFESLEWESFQTSPGSLPMTSDEKLRRLSANSLHSDSQWSTMILQLIFWWYKEQRFLRAAGAIGAPFEKINKNRKINRVPLNSQNGCRKVFRKGRVQANYRFQKLLNPKQARSLRQRAYQMRRHRRRSNRTNGSSTRLEPISWGRGRETLAPIALWWLCGGSMLILCYGGSMMVLW